MELVKDIRGIKYKELIAAAKYIENQTPFSTKHGVKGAEFENVMVIFGRGWNQYKFGQFLEWGKYGAPSGKEDYHEKNRNLFYVVCSRPKKRLSLLFKQYLSSSDIETIKSWFGEGNLVQLSL